jgi:uncharacterized membrane protein YkoI
MQTFIKVFLLTFCLTQTAFAAISLDQATRKIMEQNKSKILGAKTEMINGKKVHVIKVLTREGRIQYLKVDADSGTIIK